MIATRKNTKRPPTPRSSSSVAAADRVRSAARSTANRSTAGKKSARALSPSADELARREAARERLQTLLALKIEFIGNDEFGRAKSKHEADRLAEVDHAFDEDAAADAVRVPKGLPAYLASLYATTLLSKEDEAHLFRNMNLLKFRAAELRSKLDAENPDPAVIDQIDRLLAEAKVVRNQIIQCNLRLVVSIAKKYVDPTTSFDELVSDGNESLIRAVEKFDFARGYRFSTYATWAIRRNFFRQISDKRKRRNRFHVGEEETLDMLPGDAPQPELKEADYARLKASVANVVGQLGEREQRIVNLRFGLDSEPRPHTLQQIGEALGVSKERVRQIEGRALSKLKTLLQTEESELLARLSELL